MPRYPDLFAGLLVGGRGRRMGGRDKARLRRADGQTFAAYIAGRLAGVVAEIVVAAAPDQDFAELGLPTVVDRFAGSGPLAGLEALLASPPAPWCFLVACDLPRFDPAVLDPLVAARGGESRVVVPRTPDGLQPTCALYAAELHGEVRAMLERGELKLIDFLGRVGCREVELAAELSATLLNVNRLEDWPDGE